MGWLTSKAYAKQLADTIDMKVARKSEDVRPGVVPVPESPDTTHFSVIDDEGNRRLEHLHAEFLLRIGHRR